MAVEKLFLNNAYLKESAAVVTDVVRNEVRFDQTIFFPEGGGQVGDTGYINNYHVIDTQPRITKETIRLAHPKFPSININTEIAHIIENDSCSLKRGDTVRLKIDWKRRYSIMRVHSATHIFLHFVFLLAGKMFVKGCYIQPNKGRLDFGAKISPQIVSEIENLTNEFISKQLDITSIPLPEAPEALIWHCDEIQVPCGGTHVRNTSEIGAIKLKRRSQGKNVDRLYVQLLND